MRRMSLKVALAVAVAVGFLFSSGGPARSADEVKLGAGLVPKAGVQQTAPNQFRRTRRGKSRSRCPAWETPGSSRCSKNQSTK